MVLRLETRIQENGAVLGNNTSNGLKFFTIIKKRIIVELSSRQADLQASGHPSEAKQAGAKLTHNAKRYDARRGYHSRHG